MRCAGWTSSPSSWACCHLPINHPQLPSLPLGTNPTVHLLQAAPGQGCHRAAVMPVISGPQTRKLVLLTSPPLSKATQHPFPRTSGGSPEPQVPGIPAQGTMLLSRLLVTLSLDQSQFGSIFLSPSAPGFSPTLLPLLSELQSHPAPSQPIQVPTSWMAAQAPGSPVLRCPLGCSWCISGERCTKYQANIPTSTCPTACPGSPCKQHPPATPAGALASLCPYTNASPSKIPQIRHFCHLPGPSHAQPSAPWNPYSPLPSEHALTHQCPGRPAWSVVLLLKHPEQNETDGRGLRGQGPDSHSCGLRAQL